MKNSAYYIDEIKRVQNVESDYAVAKLLGVSRQMMTKYKNGRSSFDSNLVFKVAELSGHNPLEIIANIRASREKDPVFMKKWEKLAQLMTGTAATVILSFMVMAPLPSNVDTATDSAKGSETTLTIMLSWVLLVLQAFQSVPTKLIKILNRPYSCLPVKSPALSY